MFQNEIRERFEMGYFERKRRANLCGETTSFPEDLSSFPKQSLRRRLDLLGRLFIRFLVGHPFWQDYCTNKFLDRHASFLREFL